MEFKYTKLPTDHSRQDIMDEINRLTELKTMYANDDSALKIELNSVYGVIGFSKFICYNRDVAQTITKMSEKLIKYTIKLFDDYFKEMYEQDSRLDIMGITRKNTVKNVVNYADTDSVFLVLDEIYKSSGYSRTYNDMPDDIKKAISGNIDAIPLQYLGFVCFILEIEKYALRQYVVERLDEFLRKYNAFMTKPNGQPSLKLELEELCYSVLWVAKKKYIKNSLYSKKTVHQSLKEIKIKGLELNQSSTPLFVRKKLKDVVYHIMGGEATIKSIIDMMSVIKDEFKVVPIEMISKYERISNYEKTVINDTSGIELASGAKPHIKGAAMYNYMIKNSKYASKYERIRSGDRVHFYYTNTDIGSFSFLSGSCPIEIAPPVNIDEQFDSVFLGALNNILKVLDMPKVTPDLLNIGSIW
jgi:DNA polymerase elongation subunit (family B)